MVELFLVLYVDTRGTIRPLPAQFTHSLNALTLNLDDRRVLEVKK